MPHERSPAEPEALHASHDLRCTPPVVEQLRVSSHVVGADLVSRRLAPCSMHECGGRCCRFGAIVTLTQAERITGLVPRLLPLLRPSARRLVHRLGWSFKGTVQERYAETQEPHTASRVVEERCVFVMDAHKGGCALHALAMEDAVPVHTYKPLECVLFPLNGVVDGRVHVHGWSGYPCTHDAREHLPAYEVLKEELELMMGSDAYSELVKQIETLRAEGIEFIPAVRPDPSPVARGRPRRHKADEPDAL